MTGSKRLSQAISEGDGISLIASVDGPEAARAAERDGAKALLVGRGALAAVAAASSLPVLLYLDVEEAEAPPGADAAVVHGSLEWLEQVQADLSHELELAIRVDEEEQLEEVLERLDPEILVLACDGRAERLPHLLGLLSDVPAGKLAIAELERVDRDAIAELERAGCDAVLFGAPASSG